MRKVLICGTYRKIPKGIYIDQGYIKIRIQHQGIPIREHVGPKDESGVLDTAILRLEEIRKDIRAGKFGQEAKFIRWTVNQACDKYWELEASKADSHKTFKGFIDTIRAHMGTRWLDEISYLDVEAFRKSLSTELRVKRRNKTTGELEYVPLKLNSVNRIHTTLTRLFNALTDWRRTKEIPNVKLPVENPGAVVHRPSEKHLSRRRLITPEEFAKYWSVASERLRRISLASILTGLLQKDLQVFAEEVVKSNRSGLGVRSKTGEAYDIAVSDALVQIIGDGLDWTNFVNEFKAVRKACGLPHFQFRDFRKTGATLLYRMGFNMAALKDILGHGDISTTQLYIIPNKDDKTVAQEKLAALFMSKIKDTEPQALPKAVGE